MAKRKYTPVPDKSRLRNRFVPDMETPGGRLRHYRDQAGITAAEAVQRLAKVRGGDPISEFTWIGAEHGKPRSLDWWHSAALAIGISPHLIDSRLETREMGSIQ